MRSFTKYPKNYIASAKKSKSKSFINVKIYDDNFDDTSVWGYQPYSVEDYLYDVVHEIDGAYQILDDSSEVSDPSGKFKGYVIARVSDSIVDFMDRTEIRYDIV